MESSSSSASKTSKSTSTTKLKVSDADSPGPITPEHESGSWEQTLAAQEARKAYDEALAGKKT
jgi:hypothetical protein